MEHEILANIIAFSYNNYDCQSLLAEVHHIVQ